MLARVASIAVNTFREAVRARVLLGLFAMAFATACYSLIVANYASRSALRVIGDVGTFSLSIYAVVAAIVMGASSLYRELEQKTLFPILARPMRRGEYLTGKFLGTWLTLLVFTASNAGVLLFALSVMSRDSGILPAGVFLALVCGGGVVLLSFRARRAGILAGLAGLLVVAGVVLADEAADDRRVVLVSSLLSLLEVSIISALATLFSSFSSPALTAVLSAGVFLVGRSAETLAKLPARLFGEFIHDAGALLSKVFPNLMVYVPPRPLLTGEAAGVALGEYLAWAAIQALGWSLFLLIGASLLFKKRDFV